MGLAATFQAMWTAASAGRSPAFLSPRRGRCCWLASPDLALPDIVSRRGLRSRPDRPRHAIEPRETAARRSFRLEAGVRSGPRWRGSVAAQPQRKNLLRLSHTAERMAAERLEAAGAVHCRGGELGWDENRPAERLAQGFDAGRFVDRGPDDGEVEPVARADVAVKHLPDVEREVDGRDRDAGRRAARVQRIERLHRLDCSIERAPAGFRTARVFEGKDGQHPVADEFEHLAAARPERSRETLEDVVEQINDDGAGRGIADRGEAPDIGVPEHGLKIVD